MGDILDKLKDVINCYKPQGFAVECAKEAIAEIERLRTHIRLTEAMTPGSDPGDGDPNYHLTRRAAFLDAAKMAKDEAERLRKKMDRASDRWKESLHDAMATAEHIEKLLRRAAEGAKADD